MPPKAANRGFQVSGFTLYIIPRSPRPEGVGSLPGDVSRFTFHVSRFTFFLLLTSYFLLLTSCSFPPSTQPTFKIGLVAPFEGRYRQVGYDAIYAARLAVRQANDAGGIGGYRVELIAFDDGGEPQAATQQASMLALDPAVMGVVGHFGPKTSSAAAPIYAREGLSLLIPANFSSDDLESARALGAPLASGALCPQALPDVEQFDAEYVAVSGGTPPGPYAWAAYQAARVLLGALCLDIDANKIPSRVGVDSQLRSQCASDAHSDGAGVYLYRCEATGCCSPTVTGSGD
jgi:hypothetical protein